MTQSLPLTLPRAASEAVTVSLPKAAPEAVTVGSVRGSDCVVMAWAVSEKVSCVNDVVPAWAASKTES